LPAQLAASAFNLTGDAKGHRTHRLTWTVLCPPTYTNRHPNGF